MGRSKKKSTKRVNSLSLEEENTCSKRNEVETTSYKSNQKDVNKNQVEDKNDCKKSITEGTHFSTINNEKETKNSKLDSNKKNESKKNKEPINEQKKESLNKNKNIVLDTSESICKIPFSTTNNKMETKNSKLDSNKKNEGKKKREPVNEQKEESLNKNKNIVLDTSISSCKNSQEKNQNKNDTFMITPNKNATICDNGKSPSKIEQCYSVEIKDLFKLSKDISLACCVEENFQIETPIALQFKKIFGDIDKLMEQNLKVGEVGLVNRHNQNAFYLITKKSSSNKTIKQAFKFLLNKMTEMNITKLGIAKINFEEEGYSWSSVEKCISDVFAGSGIHVTVCIPSKKSVQPSKDSFSDNKQTQNKSEVSAFDNESNQYANKNSSQQCATSKKKKKKEKKNRDQQNVDKNTEFDCNEFKYTSSTDRQSSTFIEPEHSQYTGKNTEQRHQKDRHVQKSPNYKTDIKNQNKHQIFEGRHSISDDKNCMFEEIDQDLFKLSDEYCLAHCVAEDLRMGAGIAVEFKRIFGGVGKLIDQKLKVGNVGVVKRHNQYAFYLITKKNSSGKPTMLTMEMALRSLVALLKQFKLMKLGIPKIGCGLDGLDWDDVKSLILQIFSGSGIHITVCVPSKRLDRKAPPPLAVYITPKNLWEMEKETVIIMPINLEQVCKQNWSDHVVDEVNSRYPFKEIMLKDVRQMKLYSGAIKHYKVNGENLVCVFFLQNELYSSLEDSLKEVLKLLKPYMYLAIQSGSTAGNSKHIAWIVLILRSICNSNHCELWLCGDANQTDIRVQYDQYCENMRLSSQNYATSQGFHKNNYNRSYCPNVEFNRSGRSSLSSQQMYGTSPYKTD